MTTTITAEVEITEFEKFANDLAYYACSWVPRCRNQIIKHAREIFEDAALKAMVMTYAEEKARADKAARYEFVRACLGEDAYEVDELNEIHRAKAEHYKAVLDDLIFCSYCRA